MLAVRTPGAPQTASVGAAFSSAFPFAGQGQLLRSRSISGLFSRSLYSGLQPPCPRFAVGPLPDTTQDSVRGCSLGFTAAAISGDRVQRTLHGATPTPPYVRVRIRRFGELGRSPGRDRSQTE